MKVILVESQPLMREIVSKVCVAELGYTMIAATGSVPEAVAAIHAHRPDLVILDLVLETGNGFEVMRQTADGRHRILVLASCCSPYAVWQASHVNVHGFMAKDEIAISALKEAISSVASGGQYWSDRYRQVRLQLLTDPFSFVKVLTPAEMRVLRLVGQGLDDEEAGARLGVAPRTIQTHRGRILHKLGIQTIPKLMAYAISLGLHHFDLEKPNPTNAFVEK